MRIEVLITLLWGVMLQLGTCTDQILLKLAEEHPYKQKVYWVTINDTSGRIKAPCSSQLTEFTAKELCKRKLGLSTAPSRVHHGELFQYEYPRCGNTIKYPSCCRTCHAICSVELGPSSACSQHRDAFVDCDPDGPLKRDLTTTLRSDNHANYRGAVKITSAETFYRVHGYVCKNSTDITFGYNEAKVACRAAGKPYANAFVELASYHLDPASVGRFVMADVQCDGTEDNLWKCKHRATCHVNICKEIVCESNCNGNRVAAVYCR